MDKVDFRAERKDLYSPGVTQFAVVEVPALDFLKVDGHGDPNTSSSYAAAIEALYSLSYTAKFLSKGQGRDYTVLPLEGLWYAPNPEAFTSRAKDTWSWTMMIRQPVALSAELWDAARAACAKKDLPALSAVRLEPYAEGTSVQILHLGPYDAEAPTIQRMHEWIAANGYVENGEHHEIYLSDPRRAAPEKLKTILRQPIRVATGS